jgi:Rrf2 family protein
MHLDLTQRSDLALQALDVINQSGGQTVSGPAIAGVLRISPHYLGTIMGPLARAGWVRSSTGPTGGYRLAILVSEHSVLDLIEAMEGTVDRDTCMHGDSMQPVVEFCALHEPWTRSRDALLDVLAATNLGDVLGHDHDGTDVGPQYNDPLIGSAG